MYPERIHDPADLEEIYALRVAAWRARVESFPDIGRWTDAEDARAAHWAIRDGDRIVAAARLSIHDSLAEVPHAEIFEGVFPAPLDGPIASLNRLVVAASHRSTGLTRKLDVVRITHARGAGCRHVVLEAHADTPRIGELTAFGFAVAGPSSPHFAGPLAMVREGRGGGEIICWLPL